MPKTTRPDETDERRSRRNVLVVSSVKRPVAALRELLGEADEVRVVVPTVRQSRLQWLANDDGEVREDADAAAADIAEAVSRRRAGSRKGERRRSNGAFPASE